MKINSQNLLQRADRLGKIEQQLQSQGVKKTVAQLPAEEQAPLFAQQTISAKQSQQNSLGALVQAAADSFLNKNSDNRAELAQQVGELKSLVLINQQSLGKNVFFGTDVLRRLLGAQKALANTELSHLIPQKEMDALKGHWQGLSQRQCDVARKVLSGQLEYGPKYPVKNAQGEVSLKQLPKRNLPELLEIRAADLPQEIAGWVRGFAEDVRRVSSEKTWKTQELGDLVNDAFAIRKVCYDDKLDNEVRMSAHFCGVMLKSLYNHQKVYGTN